ncbi:hypothetical protein RDABS01_032517 [Bienertia sinuspersici]
MGVSKPIKREQRIKNKEGKVMKIEIKYERLPTFCYAPMHVELLAILRRTVISKLRRRVSWRRHGDPGYVLHQGGGG